MLFRYQLSEVCNKDEAKGSTQFCLSWPLPNVACHLKSNILSNLSELITFNKIKSLEIIACIFNNYRGKTSELVELSSINKVSLVYVSS